MVDIKWKVNKCCHQNHFCIPVNIISLPDALYFYISPDTKVLSHFVPLLVSRHPEHFWLIHVFCAVQWHKWYNLCQTAVYQQFTFKSAKSCR